MSWWAAAGELSGKYTVEFLNAKNINDLRSMCVDHYSREKCEKMETDLYGRTRLDLELANRDLLTCFSRFRDLIK